MSQVGSDERERGSRMRISRSRGALSGTLVILLGAWGALVPFVGPAFDFAYDQDAGAFWSAARGWLEVLPGIVAAIGGLLLVRSQNRVTAMLGGWLSVVAGAWFVVGRVVATTLTIGEIGGPVAQTDAKAAWLELTYFYGLGAAIVFLGAMALGRLSVRSVRDVEHAQKEQALKEHAKSTAMRRDTRPDAVDESTGALQQPATHQPTTHHPTMGQTRTQAVGGERVLDEHAARRIWRNPLGRRRGDSTPTGL